MKKFLCFILILILCFCSVSLAFADDESAIGSDGTSDPSADDIIDGRTNPYLDPEIANKLDTIVELLETPTVANAEVGEGNTTMQVLRISASDTSGLHAIILSLIGDYNPIVKDYTYTSSNGYTSHSIDIQPDWSWIASAAIFLVVVYSAFRIFGMLIGAIHG